jgi:hypothetical protein
MAEMPNWKASILGALAGFAGGTVFGMLAFLFLSKQQGPAMGEALFLLVPVVAGFSITLVARKWDTAAGAGFLSVLVTLVLLIALGKEGVLCALLSLPIIAFGLAIGIGIGMLARKVLATGTKNGTGTTGMLLLIGPILIVVGERIETPTLRQPRTEVIQTAIQVNDPPDRVWGNILSIDNIRASKPMLMYVGLPIPQRCTMQGRGVGAKRTCYFDVGYIEETVTEWSPPSRLGLSIDRTHMPGRHWLGFENAEYLIESQGRGTVVTRRTTVSSYLHPAWYWRPFERLGVEEEHEYILRDLALKAGH